MSKDGASTGGNDSGKSIHKPVLLHEVVEGLLGQVGGLLVFEGLSEAEEAERERGFSRNRRDPRTQESDHSLVYLDGTLGGAGHASAIAEAFGGKLTVIGLDRDPAAIARAAETLKGKAEKVILLNVDFRNLDKVLADHSIKKVDRVFLDLGLSSDEIEKSGRGFSFQRNEPLHMTFGDPSQHPFTALSIVNSWKEEDIANVIYAYGEERYARRIAKAIVEHRREKHIETSGDLADLIKKSVPAAYARGKIHPATRTFQALRIAVNDELAALKEGLIKAWDALEKGGILAVISFHSLEDRIVKEFFKEKGKKFKEERRKEEMEKGASGENILEKQEKISQGIIITKKPITASREEINENQRSRSAKLRIIKKAE